MPKGQKTIDWTEANDARLLLTIVAVENIRPNHQKVAAAFGMDVGATAIQSRLVKLRQKAKNLGIAPEGSNGGTKATGRARTAPKTNGKGHKPEGMLNEPDSDEESGDVKTDDEVKEEQTLAENGSTSHRASASNGTKNIQKTITGRVTKKRASPRKTGKKDYKALDDPFPAMNGTTDADEDKVFHTEKSESEDEYPSDEEYMKDAKAASIKLEEAI